MVKASIGVKAGIGRVNVSRRAGFVVGCCSLAMLTACSPSSNSVVDAAAEPPSSVSSTTAPNGVGNSNGVSGSGPVATPDNSGSANGSAELLTTGGPVARSVTSAEERSLLITGDDASTKLWGNLPQPDLVRLLPAGLPQVGPDAALNLIATPTVNLTPAYASPNDAQPVLALNSDTDEMLNMPAHWAVVGKQGDWLQVLTPVGRGSLPSKDKSQVNHHAVWIKASDVNVTPAQYTIEVSTTDYTMTVTGPSGSHTFHVGVGKAGVTDTPKGLCAVVGKVVIQSGEPGLLTNCQSEMIDGFDGAADAATAIHEYEHLGFDPAVGGSVSNGCMRIPDPSYEKYLTDIPAGTPVIIR